MVAALIGRLAHAPSAVKWASGSTRRKTEEGPAEIGKVATSAPITGPERSVITDADTTKAAVTAMRSTSVGMKIRSGDIFSVVPAKAGAHNHDCSCGAKAVEQRFLVERTRRMGPGSALRLAGTTLNHIRCIVTETFGPFLMVW